ncbi:MAG: hypothetical protein H0W83_07195 [Planctomycetes bacterium]|nr:hypothetical protein [Planctomycetota bacterium]
MKSLACAWLLLLTAISAGAQDAPLMKEPVYWVHRMNNTNNDETTAKTYALMERAAKAGYTGIAYHDGRLVMRQFQTPQYMAKLGKFREKATELKLTIAASLAAIGYGDEFLMNDLNLAEGMPVRKATFIVKDGKLVPHDPDLRLLNGGFEDWTGAAPAKWEIDDLGTAAFKDDLVKAEGAFSVRTEGIKAKSEHGRTRQFQRIKVAPFHNYSVTVMVKTDKCTNRDIRIMGLDTYALNWTGLPIEETMDWTRIGITFNSLEANEVGIYMGTWDGGAGTMWWDDVRIEPAGFINVIRRDSLPLTVTSEDGTATYDEGKDFAKVADPLFTPCLSGWHAQPSVPIPAGSRLKEGQKVLVSYHHAMTNLQENNTPVCMSCPKVYDEIRHSIQFAKDNLHPDVYFLAHDEIRQCGYDDDCAKRKLTPGQILADNIAKCVKMVEEIDPGKPVVVWSDMFDPNHLAAKTEEDGKTPFHHFLVKGDGPWWESWKGMPKQLGVVNWNNGNVKSSQFFDGEGHQQVLSHSSVEGIVKWLDETKGKHIAGVMYTTWEDDYSPLEKYIDAVKQWQAKNPQR